MVESNARQSNSSLISVGALTDCPNCSSKAKRYPVVGTKYHTGLGLRKILIQVTVQLVEMLLCGVLAFLCLIFPVFLFYLCVSIMLVFRKHKQNCAHESLEQSSDDSLTRKYWCFKVSFREWPY